MTNSARGSTSSRDPSMRVEQSSEQILPSKGRKLTEAQQSLLKEICDLQGGRPISATYSPALKLIEFGYAEIIEKKYSDYLVPTDAGRAALGDGGGR